MKSFSVEFATAVTLVSLFKVPKHVPAFYIQGKFEIVVL
jgi:hypothetical protein